MATPFIATAITAEPLDIGAAITEVSTPECGGIAVFIGTVRDHGDNGAVKRLEYEAHPDLSEQRLAQVAQDATRKWDTRRIVARHRTGICEAGEPTVVVACAAEHRAEALEACRWIIDEIKAEVPIWKREVYSHGSTWVGAEGDA